MPVYEAALAGKQIQPQFLAVEGRTRENITLLDPVHHTETHVRDAGLPVSAEDTERMLKKLNLLSGPGRLVIFSGSLPPGLEPGRFREMVEVVLGVSARVGLDVPGEALAELADLPAWVIKPNAEELAALAGGAMDSDARILEAGCRLSRRIRVVIVSRGEAGGYAFVDGSALMGQVDVDPARVVSTVGCGDALLAGFVAAQMRGDDVRASYRFALAVASAAAVTAVPGRFSLEEVADFLPRASVEAVEG
jgi:1-phosphofructokinase family hexose kinase